MGKITYYDQLGLPRDASQEEIRHAYRQLVLRLHPDKNAKRGETHLFLDIQQAYENLADPFKRATYDRLFPGDTTTETPLNIQTFFSQPSLVRLPEPQLIYSLIEFKNQVQSDQLSAATPFNISLVVDCSTSMQGIRLDTVKSTAIDLVRQLQSDDIFSLVKFNDRAELLIPAGNLADLKSTEMKIQLLQAGGGTEIFKGLDMGFSQVSEFQSSDRVNHIILITDGRTYGDEQSCDKLADQSSALGISISALGIGNQWNDRFLDHITSKTGGICEYISDIGDIRSSILREISRLGSHLTEQITYNFQTSQDVELRTAYRLQPDSAPLVVGPPLVFGYIPKQGVMSILLEFLINDIPSGSEDLTLAKGFINYEIPRHKLKTQYVDRLNFKRKITINQIREILPTKILNALATLNIYRMQERAREEMASGEISSATNRMENLARQLTSKGEAGLAQTVRDEIAYIHQNQTYSEEGEKRIKYGTRALLLPTGGEE